LALSRAIEVNEAWRVFKDPVRRAEALLMRLGIDASETSGAKADPELLMEMMEHREDLAQARMTKDVSRLSSLITMMKEREEKVIASLTQAFEKEPPSASAHLAELRFVRRFLEEASVAEDELL
jgi:molecular chaperone HscB